MTTTITLPDTLARQLQRKATITHRSVEALAIEYIAAALTEENAPMTPSLPADDADLRALVASIKAMPPNPASIVPAKGNLSDVFAAMSQGEPDQEILDALVAAELELRALNRADDLAEGRG